MSPPTIYGLIGYPVEHSLSAVMHNAGFRALNIPAEYRLFPIPGDSLRDFLLRKDFPVKDTEGNSVSSGSIQGFNITIPHKVAAQQILSLLPSVDLQGDSQDAYYVRLCGAINTVKRHKDGFTCRNTDVNGFIRSLKEDLKFTPEAKTVLVFGCGGAGRAVIAGLTSHGMGVQKVYVYDASREALETAVRHFSQFDFLKGKLEFVSEDQIPERAGEVQLLVNASPVGMKEEDGSLVKGHILHKGLSVYDVVYNRKTQLLKDAEALGIPVVGGLGMLLYQATAAFELWTEHKAPVSKMRSALIEAVKV